MTNPDIPALATRSQQGDRKAFESLVALTARMVYAQIVAAVRDRQKAEDLTQETFIAAWKSLDKLTDPAGFNSWLLTLARNLTLDAIKFDSRKKRNANGPPAAGEAAANLRDSAASPEAQAQSNEAAARVLAMLEDLPEDYRKPLTLRYLGGCDYDQIKTQLNLTDGALRGLLNRGMAMLRERMTSEAPSRRKTEPRP